ncbi:PREDICTED: puromycin resistance protein pur8-like, partial [Trachymyrmex septentrionalis]|uniref:puromycin resistance protein pur8-like n=1 Tax=Trachymyrmex septentrionalis TaxID=34720 RepID=UPI00084F16A6
MGLSDAEGRRSVRWWALAVVSLVQLMIVLDATIVNIALPAAQRELGMSDASRQWVITAYALVFGGLLLLGGRVSSRIGHRRAITFSLCGFAAASAIGGLAASPLMLFVARGIQGVFAAVLAPAVLALLSVMFTDSRHRGTAFGVFAAVSAAGSAVGLLAGGVFTEYLDWRWCLYVNIPLSLVALFGTPLLSPAQDGERHRIDLLGALLSAVALAAVV